MNALSRRAVLAAGVGLGIGVPFALGARGASSTGAVLPSLLPLPPAFAVPLPVPPVLSPVRRDADADYYEITQTRAEVSLLPGVRTGIWGYNGVFPGPTVVSRRGRKTVVTHRNLLPVPTVAHLHGGRTPPGSDGYPMDLVPPLSTVDYEYPLDQRAATLWYHDHRMGFTGLSVWRGLAGFHLVRDDEEDALGLPSGAREIPLMIADRSFDADGSPRYPSLDPTLTAPGVTQPYMGGVLGDVMLVNGAPWPVATVEGAQYRLRILNACNARRLDLRLDPGGPLTQIGTDGGLLAAPLRHDHVELAPAQRLDAIVDFGVYPPGTVVRLVNDFGAGRMAEVLRFHVGERAPDTFRLPDRLSTIEPLGPPAVTRTLYFQNAGDKKGWRINGAPFDMDAIAARPALGSVETWRLVSDFHHPVHLHASPFQVLSRGITGPGPFDAGWKDTIDLRPAEEAAIAVRFDGYRGKYVFHCHNLEHEDMAMMGNFVVS